VIVGDRACFPVMPQRRLLCVSCERLEKISQGPLRVSNGLVMTCIAIPSGRENLYSGIFMVCNERKLNARFVVKILSPDPWLRST
jgi:hypothetical protein